MKKKFYLFLIGFILSVFLCINFYPSNSSTIKIDSFQNTERQNCLAFEANLYDCIGDIDPSDYTGGGSTGYSYNMSASILTTFPNAKIAQTVNCYNSYSSFKSAYGSASKYVADGHWHHIVEQQSVKNGINSAQSIYNNHNTVAIPRSVHQLISAHYSSLFGTTGQTVRQYVNTLSYNEQFDYGLNILNRFCKQVGFDPNWN